MAGFDDARLECFGAVADPAKSLKSPSLFFARLGVESERSRCGIC